MFFIEVAERCMIHTIVIEGKRDTLILMCSMLEENSKVSVYKVRTMSMQLRPKQDFNFSEDYFKKWVMEFPKEVFSKWESDDSEPYQEEDYD